MLLLVGCASRQPTTVTVLTYNIHHGAGTDGKFDLQRIANVIKQSGADLVALQEVDRNTSRTKSDEPTEFEKLTGFHAVFGAAMDFGGGQYGDLVLSRYPVEQVDVHALPWKEGGKREPRCLVIARVRAPGGSIVFASTHLDHTGGADHDRVLQSKGIVEKLGHETAPTIIAGDFNCEPGSEAANVVTKVWIDSTGPGPTIPSDKPTRKIDFIFTSAHFKSLESEVIDEPIASDHRPVRAKLEMK